MTKGRCHRSGFFVGRCPDGRTPAAPWQPPPSAMGRAGIIALPGTNFEAIPNAGTKLTPAAGGTGADTHKAHPQNNYCYKLN
jgi:hypothetical protein